MKVRFSTLLITGATIVLTAFSSGYLALYVSKAESVEGVLTQVSQRDKICGLTRQTVARAEEEKTLAMPIRFHAVVSSRVCEKRMDLLGKRVLVRGERVSCHQINEPDQITNSVSCFKVDSIELR